MLPPFSTGLAHPAAELLRTSFSVNHLQTDTQTSCQQTAHIPPTTPNEGARSVRNHITISSRRKVCESNEDESASPSASRLQKPHWQQVFGIGGLHAARTEPKAFNEEGADAPESGDDAGAEITKYSDILYPNMSSRATSAPPQARNSVLFLNIPPSLTPPLWQPKQRSRSLTSMPTRDPLFEPLVSGSVYGPATLSMSQPAERGATSSRTSHGTRRSSSHATDFAECRGPSSITSEACSTMRGDTASAAAAAARKSSCPDWGGKYEDARKGHHSTRRSRSAVLPREISHCRMGALRVLDSPLAHDKHNPVGRTASLVSRRFSDRIATGCAKASGGSLGWEANAASGAPVATVSTCLSQISPEYLAGVAATCHSEVQNETFRPVRPAECHINPQAIKAKVNSQKNHLPVPVNAREPNSAEGVTTEPTAGVSIKPEDSGVSRVDEGGEGHCLAYDLSTGELDRFTLVSPQMLGTPDSSSDEGELHQRLRSGSPSLPPAQNPPSRTPSENHPGMPAAPVLTRSHSKEEGRGKHDVMVPHQQGDRTRTRGRSKDKRPHKQRTQLQLASGDHVTSEFEFKISSCAGLQPTFFQSAATFAQEVLQYAADAQEDEQRQKRGAKAIPTGRRVRARTPPPASEEGTGSQPTPSPPSAEAPKSSAATSVGKARFPGSSRGKCHQSPSVQRKRQSPSVPGETLHGTPSHLAGGDGGKMHSEASANNISLCHVESGLQQAPERGQWSAVSPPTSGHCTSAVGKDSAQPSPSWRQSHDDAVRTEMHDSDPCDVHPHHIHHEDIVAQSSVTSGPSTEAVNTTERHRQSLASAKSGEAAGVAQAEKEDEKEFELGGQEAATALAPHSLIDHSADRITAGKRAQNSASAKPIHHLCGGGSTGSKVAVALGAQISMSTAIRAVESSPPKGSLVSLGPSFQHYSLPVTRKVLGVTQIENVLPPSSTKTVNRSSPTALSASDEMPTHGPMERKATLGPLAARTQLREDRRDRTRSPEYLPEAAAARRAHPSSSNADRSMHVSRPPLISHSPFEGRTPFAKSIMTFPAPPHIQHSKLAPQPQHQRLSYSTQLDAESRRVTREEGEGRAKVRECHPSRGQGEVLPVRPQLDVISPALAPINASPGPSRANCTEGGDRASAPARVPAIVATPLAGEGLGRELGGVEAKASTFPMQITTTSVTNRPVEARTTGDTSEPRKPPWVIKARTLTPWIDSKAATRGPQPTSISHRPPKREYQKPGVDLGTTSKSVSNVSEARDPPLTWISNAPSVGIPRRGAVPSGNPRDIALEALHGALPAAWLGNMPRVAQVCRVGKVETKDSVKEGDCPEAHATSIQFVERVVPLGHASSKPASPLVTRVPAPGTRKAMSVSPLRKSWQTPSSVIPMTPGGYQPSELPSDGERRFPPLDNRHAEGLSVHIAGRTADSKCCTQTAMTQMSPTNELQYSGYTTHEDPSQASHPPSPRPAGAHDILKQDGRLAEFEKLRTCARELPESLVRDIRTAAKNTTPTALLTSSLQQQPPTLARVESLQALSSSSQQHPPIHDAVSHGSHHHSRHGEAKSNAHQRRVDISLNSSPKVQYIVGLASLQGCKPANPTQPNQDRCFIQRLGNSLTAFAVFDGHGEAGHLVADFVSEAIRTMLVEEFGTVDEPRYTTAMSCEKKAFTWMRALFQRADKKLQRRHPTLNQSYSGCTCSLALKQEDHIYIAYIGDSKVAVYIFKTSLPAQIIETNEHHPAAQGELARIEEAGGKVSQIYFPHLRKRVSRIMQAGISVSRAFGDLAARQFGLTCQPEFLHVDASKTEKSRPYSVMMVLGTDGLWDTVRADEIPRMIPNQSRTKESLLAIVEQLVEMAWTKRVKAEGSSDDTSAILALIR